jgi:D-alanyl-D-alanine carboxypeptidase
MADVPATLEDTIAIGSISKSFAGTVHLRLVEQGLYSLEDTVAELVPDFALEFPDISNYTVFELLGMRTSIPDFFNEEDSSMVGQFLQDTDARFTKREIIAFAMQGYPKYVRENYTYYSTTNVLIMEIIAETITGRDMAELLQEYVYTPLNLTTARLLPFDATTQEFVSPPPTVTSFMNSECLAEFPPNATQLGADASDAESTIVSVRTGGAIQMTLGEMLIWAKSGTGDTLLSNETVQVRHDARAKFSSGFDPRAYGLYQNKWAEDANYPDLFVGMSGLYGHSGQTFGTLA